MSQEHEPVAVLGIGTMGHGMATSALRAGIPTTVWNRNPLVTRDLADLGAEVAETAADAARSAAIVVTMVTDADAVISIALNEGMLAALAPGAILVQMSTIGVTGIERVAAMVAAERPDVVLLDAPVSGSKDPAEQGLLTIFASGPDEARLRVTPLFDALWASERSGPAMSGLALDSSLWPTPGSPLSPKRSPPLSHSHEVWASRPNGWWKPSTATRSCLLGRQPSCIGSRAASSRLNSLYHWPSRMCASPRKPPPVASALWRAWPMNGSRQSIRASATKM